MHLLIKQTVNTYYVPGTILDSEDTTYTVLVLKEFRSKWWQK